MRPSVVAIAAALAAPPASRVGPWRAAQPRVWEHLRHPRVACDASSFDGDCSAAGGGSLNVSIGDVLAEVASRQLSDVDPLEMAGVRIDTMLDIGAYELSQVLDRLDRNLSSVGENTSGALRVEMDAVQQQMMQRFDNVTEALSAQSASTREFVRHALGEELQATSNDVEQIAPLAPERLRTLQRIAEARDRPVVLLCQASASLLGLMAGVAVLNLLSKHVLQSDILATEALRWAWSLVTVSALGVYLASITVIVWEADEALLALDPERLGERQRNK